MSFTPDVPSSALSANEYNAGFNIETDVRSIKSVLGDQYILNSIPGTIIFVTSGFDNNGNFWFIIATAGGNWYALDNAGYTNITPSYGSFGGYNANTVITASWNGNIVFINDQTNPPMYFAPNQWNQIRLYGYPPDNYVWNYDQAYDINGNVVPAYSSLIAGFIRVYNSPNVGSLLVAGNLAGTLNANVYPNGGTIQDLPTTIRWSQNFGINSGPTTWVPTVTTIANQVEAPLRDQVVDGFPLNGNFYFFSYWDCALLSPIAYTSTNAPVFGLKPLSRDRGLINENCWAVVDSISYGVDARDIWKFDGGTFTPLGDQRIKNYFFQNLNGAYTNQVFMVHNSAKYQIEIYYPDLNSTGYCNQMLSYRYDLDVWNPPRQVNKATMATESPRWYGTQANVATRCIVYSSAQGNVQLVQKDIGTSFLGNTISSLFQRNNISFGQPYSASVQIHRVLPEVYGTGNIDITVGGSDAVANPVVYKPTVTMPIVTNNPWVQINQNESRVNTIQLSANSTANTWQVSGLNWQITVVQDTR